MVKTLDFDSENSGSSPGEAAKEVEQIVRRADELVQKACLITEGPPFFMGAEEEYARLRIEGEKATLYWPEYAGGYYAGDGSMETQSCSFPAWMLSRPLDEVKAWKADERREYDAEEKAKRELAERQRAEHQTALELHALAVLKAKYEKPDEASALPDDR